VVLLRATAPSWRFFEDWSDDGGDSRKDHRIVDRLVDTVGMRPSLAFWSGEPLRPGMLRRAPANALPRLSHRVLPPPTLINRPSPPAPVPTAATQARLTIAGLAASDSTLQWDRDEFQLSRLGGALGFHRCKSALRATDQTVMAWPLQGGRAPRTYHRAMPLQGY